MASNEDAWELRQSLVLVDPQGMLERTRDRVVELLPRRGMGRARVASTLTKLSAVERDLARLVRATKAADRAQLALPFARGLFGLGQRDEYSGLIGLTLRLASQLAGGQVLRWHLREEATRGAGLVLPQLDLTLALSQAMDVPGLGEEEVGHVAAASLHLARSEAASGEPLSTQTIANLDRYQRMIDSGASLAALTLLRGEAARWLGQRSAYLALCGLVMPGRQVDMAAAWPQLLAVLSTWLAASQALRDRAASPEMPLSSPD